MATGNQSKKTSAAKKKNKARARIVIFAIEIVIILVMLVVVAKVFKTTEEVEGPHFAEIEETQIVINSEVEENPVLKGYWNVALFGVDATTDSQLFKGSRSDSIMVASINLDTGDIKLVSVYRDTYLNQGNDSYRKANNAYSTGGAEQAIGMLNMNLDLDITDFVTVNYQGLADCIDGLGGIYLDIDEAEIKHINNYQITISKDVMDGDYVPVEETGYQLVDGLQAAAYCRIRYTAGDDFKRAERQREVIQAIAEQAKKADISTLTKVFTKVIDNVYTSISQEDILGMLKEVGNYSIVDEGGFPHEDMRAVGTIGTKGSCVIPVSLEENVQWLHEFLFEDEGYTVSSDVKDYSQRIEEETSPYIQR
ncbi:MAG: LCP family protein [Lachnospiraceae bacterium]|nr:LCP family protein [Lachnospiraceae bacterium]